MISGKPVDFGKVARMVAYLVKKKTDKKFGGRFPVSLSVIQSL